MADVTISGLAQTTPGPSFLLPCSDGATTYASCISSLFANMGNKYVYVLGNSNANNTGTGMYLRNTYEGNGFTAIYFGNDGALNAGCVWQGSKNYTNYAGPSSMNIGTLYDAPLGLVTGNTVRMYVSGNGNVGIGTTTPAAKLDVNGDVKATNIPKFAWARFNGSGVIQDSYGVTSITPGAVPGYGNNIYKIDVTAAGFSNANYSVTGMTRYGSSTNFMQLFTGAGEATTYNPTTTEFYINTNNSSIGINTHTNYIQVMGN